jgi:hypothetical protein
MRKDEKKNHEEDMGMQPNNQTGDGSAIKQNKE